LKYALLIYSSKSMRREDLNEEQLREIYDGYSAIFAIPGVTGGTQLHGIETATSVRRENGRTVLDDGPFVNGGVALIGSFLYEGADLDAALAVAEQVTAVNMGGGVEVRPIVE
jgi:hypothetical protein